MTFSLDDVPLSSTTLRSFYERWRHPEIATTDGESLPRSIIDSGGEAHYGMSAKDLELRQRLSQSEYQLEHYRNSCALFRELFGELESALPRDITKKEKIVYSKLVFGDEESAPSNSVIGLSTPISREYAVQFKYDPNATEVRQREQVPRSLRTQLIDDCGGCSRCGNTEGIEIHHIIPYVEGGPTKRSNLAPLCQACHSEAHHAYQGGSSGYSSVDEFWDWVEG